ncbi:MAG: outer rane transport energization protein TonB [Chthonomonadaceae bacterium]|nr:outer rane transport energization protein TonB [Chthonomonadaceae bacterium]
MNPTLTNDNRASGLQDGLTSRLMVGFVASLVLNFVLWRAAAAIAKHPPVFTPRPVEITRVILDNKGHKTEKVVTKHDIQKKKEIVRRKPVVVPIPKPLPRPTVPKPPTPHVAKLETVKPTPSPPDTAHNRILTAPPDKTAPPKPDDHTALAGGNAPVGLPTEHQGTGNAVVNPPVIPKVEPKVTPKVEPKVEPKVDPIPAKVDPPKVENVAPPVEVVKPTPAKPKGPSREAQPDNQTNPEIPDELKHGNFKSFVRVKVEIDTDGSFTPILRTSSGNADIDSRVLEALKKWKWKPALKDGVPVKSVQLFKFEFEVQ